MPNSWFSRPRSSGRRDIRLEALTFLKLHLSYRHQGSDRTAAGQLVSVGAEYVVLEADSNSFAVPLEGITRLQVLERPLRIHVARDSGKAPSDTTLGMAYLRKGITWIPEYTLKILDADTAELSLRGTLVNEAEDLVHCDVNFVVGVPHFLHTDYLAPIAVGQVIRSIGAAVAPREVMSQMMNRAAVARDFGSAQPGVFDQAPTHPRLWPPNAFWATLTQEYSSVKPNTVHGSLFSSSDGLPVIDPVAEGSASWGAVRTQRNLYESRRVVSAVAAPKRSDTRVCDRSGK